MDKMSITRAIQDRVEDTQEPTYSAWRIGITHDLSSRNDEWGNPEDWMDWEADSLSDAKDIESYFIHTMGMNGGTGGDLTVGRRIWVYIF